MGSSCSSQAPAPAYSSNIVLPLKESVDAEPVKMDKKKKRSAFPNSAEPPDDFHDYRDNNLDLQAMIEHFMPPDFPIVDCITMDDIERAQKSWDYISATDEKGNVNPIMIELVDEFFHRLLQRANKFRKLFKNPRDRAMVLTKAVGFLLHTNQQNMSIRVQKYKDIGILHRNMGISHWMFSMYMTTLIETLAYVMKGAATMDVMESWVRLCSYSLRYVLEAVVTEQNVMKLEYAANFNTALEDDLKRRDDANKANHMAKIMSESGSQFSAMTGMTDGWRAGRATQNATIEDTIVEELEPNIPVGPDRVLREARRRDLISG